MSRSRVGSSNLSFTSSLAFTKALAGCSLLALLGLVPGAACAAEPAVTADEKPVAAPNAAPKVSLPYKLLTAPQAESPSAAAAEAAPAKPEPAPAKQAATPAAKPVDTPLDKTVEKQASQQIDKPSDASVEPKSGIAAAMPAVKPEPPKITLYIDIDLTRQRMTVSEYGKPVGAWPISSGAEGHRSPTGTFRPVWSSKMWYSKQYDNAPMPHAVFFSGGVALHATQSVGRLGTPASHGCIRQSPANAATTYKLVAKHGNAHTKIVVHGKPRDDEPRVARRDRDAASARLASRDGRYERPRYSENQATRRVIIVDGYGNRRIAEIRADDPRLAAYQNRRPYGGYGYGNGGW